jgi:hypothetical protein
MAHDGLGLSAEEAGMTHSPDTNEMLEMADPFDRAFVDEMVPHHTGAVKMAEVVLEGTEDAELRTLAENIISTQEREIKEMNDFRTEEYGAPVPETSGGGGGEHGGGHSGLTPVAAARVRAAADPRTVYTAGGWLPRSERRRSTLRRRLRRTA